MVISVHLSEHMLSKLIEILSMSNCVPCRFRRLSMSSRIWHYLSDHETLLRALSKCLIRGFGSSIEPGTEVDQIHKQRFWRLKRHAQMHPGHPSGRRARKRTTRRQSNESHSFSLRGYFHGAKEGRRSRPMKRPAAVEGAEEKGGAREMEAEAEAELNHRRSTGPPRQLINSILAPGVI